MSEKIIKKREKIDIMAFDKETSEIIALRAAKRKELEKAAIEANIAKRDAYREAKQKWEDDGMPGPYNPNYKASIQKFVEAAQEAKKEEDLRKEIKITKQDLIKKVVEAEVDQEIATEAADQATELIEKAILSIDDIMDNHQDWINLYENETGMKAIWKGRITNGFKEFLDTNGFS